MKKFLAVVMVVAATGCASTNNIAQKTLATISITAEAGRAAYVEYANECGCVTSNDFQKVEIEYAHYQAAMAAAQKAETAANANASDSVFQRAYAAVAASAADFAKLISDIIRGK